MARHSTCGRKAPRSLSPETRCDRRREGSGHPRDLECRPQMDRARWQRIEEIFAAALAEPLDARATFRDSRCADDAELRREVESLLTHHREDDFLQPPVAPEAMRLLGEA